MLTNTRGACTLACRVESHSTPCYIEAPSVGMSADATRKSACATSSRAEGHQ